LRDQIAVALWVVPPWIVVAWWLYGWLVAGFDLNRARVAVFLGVYGGVRLFCRLMMLSVLCRLGAIKFSCQGRGR
jgi:hypothetical protein